MIVVTESALTHSCTAIDGPIHLKPKGFIEAGTEYLEFSPREEYEKTMKVVARNLEGMQGK
ncbi:MAG: hypothetical protein NWE75_05230 [Candidatus Bathyarchaeota archaeon]|nr:hypothetical protein [Candidatus Bathyarchaeota archaeon]